MKSRKIRAVHETDLLGFLQSISLLEQIENGEIMCSKCRREVTVENFDSVGMRNGSIVVYCSRVDCMGEREEKDSAV